VVVSFGSMATDDSRLLADTLTVALRRAELRAIVQRGAAELEPVSDEILVVGELDHRALFPRSTAVVHHGGAGTSHAAAAAGVPSVVVPHVGDQVYWADRLHRLMAAPAPLPAAKLNADVLAARLREATMSPALRDGARSLAQRMSAEDGLGLALQRLEELLPGG